LPELKLYSPENWKDYELIDSGDLEKLERFGKFFLTRPEPQAVWGKSLPVQEWEKLSHATYKRTKGIDPAKADVSEKGDWKKKTGMPDQWFISYSCREMNLRFRLGLTSFGHIGIFPEQAVNWDYIYDSIKQYYYGKLSDLNEKEKLQITDYGLRKPESQHPVSDIQHPASSIQYPAPSIRHPASGIRHPAFRVLNLFAYTGGASLAAKAAGADVVHVDSVKPVIQWAKEDMELCGLTDIRWVVEDALKFVRREVKRGNKYNGIILDPPAYGRGPEGEKWILQESVNEMIMLCSKLLAEHNSFFVLSLYSMGFSSLISDSLVKTHFGDVQDKQTGELFFTDRAGRKLPLGTFLRFNR
jgi:23S rRNA (cytosine1962-C5)-methyltransferase